MKIGKLAAVGMILVASGCGQGASKVVPVEGTVTLNGKPLEGAEVAFVPEDPGPTLTAGIDRTGPSGNFKVIARGRSGLVPGKYKVYVSRGEAPESAAPDAFMTKLAAATASTRKGAKKPTAPSRASFNREVYASGGPIDIDIKAKTF